MTMTKREYNMLASVLAKSANPPPNGGTHIYRSYSKQHTYNHILITNICIALKNSNPRFDINKFVGAVHSLYENRKKQESEQA